MPFNGSGGFTPIPPPDYPAIANTTILAESYNAFTADLMAGLGQCITRDGQSPATANIPMGGNKFTNVGVATGAGEALTWGQAATFGDLTTTGNTILGDAATDTLNVGAGGIVKDATGAVGIGTSTMTEKFNVGQGNAYILRTGGAKLRLADQFNVVSFESVPVGGGSDAIIVTGGIERVRVDAAGSVGVGITPVSKLDVSSTGTAIYARTSSETGLVSAFATVNSNVGWQCPEWRI